MSRPQIGIQLLFPSLGTAKEFGSVEPPALIHALRPLTVLLWLVVFAIQGYAIVVGGGTFSWVALVLSTVLFVGVQGQAWYEESEQGRRFHRSLERLRGQIYEDAATGLPNSRHFVFQLRRQMMRSVRNGAGFSLVLLSIDHSDDHSDEDGAPSEEALRTTAKSLRHAMSEGDFVARLQGPTFGALVLDDPDRSATVKAREIEELVAENLGEAPRCSISGYEGELEVRDFLGRAQRNLHASRREGYPVVEEALTA